MVTVKLKLLWPCAETELPGAHLVSCKNQKKRTPLSPPRWMGSPDNLQPRRQDPVMGRGEGGEQDSHHGREGRRQRWELRLEGWGVVG